MADGSVTALTNPDTGHVAVTSADGKTDFVRREDLPAALAEGSRPATEAEYWGAKTPAAIAGAEGLARGLSFGVSDPLIVEGTRLLGGEEAGERARVQMRGAEKAHHGLETAAEIGGAVLPAFFGAPEGLETAAESVLGRAAERAAVAVPENALIGAAQGLGSQLSEDTLQNRQFSAENYWSAGLHGGLLGALVGGVASPVLGYAGDKAATLFGRGLPGVEKAAEKGAASAEKEAGGFGDWLAKTAEEKAFKATGAKTEDRIQLAATAEAADARAKRMGRMMLDEGIASPFASKVDMAERTEALRQKVGAELGNVYTELDSATTKPSLAAIGERFNERVLKPLLDHPLGGVSLDEAGNYIVEKGSPAAEAVRFRDGMLAKGGPEPSFKQLQTYAGLLKDMLDPKKIRAGLLPPPPGAQALEGLRGAIKDEILSAGEKAAGEVGGSVVERLKVNNELYADLKTLGNILRRETARTGGMNTIGLRTAHFAAEAIGAVAAGHPLALLGPIGMHVAHAHGDTLAAKALDKASVLFGATRATAAVEKRLSAGAESFLRGKAGETRPVKLRSTDEIRAIREAVRDETAVSQRVSDVLRPITPHAPNLAQDIATTAARTAAYLRDALPKEQAPISPFASTSSRPMSDSERILASHMIEVADDPTIVIDRLVDGRLSFEHVEALKATAPETYNAIRSYLASHAAELRPKLSIQQQAGLSILFGEPINEAFLPGNVKAFQASFTGGNQAPGPEKPVNQPGGPPPPPGPTFNLGKSAGSHATQFDQMERGQ